jgi:hypothetical protein
MTGKVEASVMVPDRFTKGDRVCAITAVGSLNGFSQ